MSSEASGHIVLKASDKLSHELEQCGDFVPLKLIGSLLESAGLRADSYLNKTTITDADLYMELDLSEGLDLEDTTQYIDGYICFLVRGADWISLSQILTKVGDGLEIYSRINDDEGFHYWIGRNPARVIFDNIGDDTGSIVSSDWDSFIPEQVKSAFPNILPNPKPKNLESNATRTYQDSHFTIIYPSDFEAELSDEIEDDLEWSFSHVNGLSMHIFSPPNSWNLDQLAEYEKSETIENYGEEFQVREKKHSTRVSQENVEVVTQQFYLEDGQNNTVYESRIFMLSGPLTRYAVVDWRRGTQDSLILDEIVKSIQLNR